MFWHFINKELFFDILLIKTNIKLFNKDLLKNNILILYWCGYINHFLSTKIYQKIIFWYFIDKEWFFNILSINIC